MNRLFLALLPCLPAVLAATCSGDSARPKTDSGIQVTGSGAQVAQGGTCSLLTAAEVSEAFGTPVENGEMAAMGTGCQWAAKNNDTAFAQIQILSDTTGYGTPIQAPSYQKLTGIDGRGFSVVDPQGGWRAEAATGKGHYAVQLIGSPSASRDGAVAVLRKLMERR